MKIKIFESSSNGKIEFTRAELEKLLNEVYTDGYKEGEHNARSRAWTWNGTYLNNYGTSASNKAATDPTATSASINFTVDKSKTDSNNSVATDCDNIDTKTNAANTTDKPPVYKVKISNSITRDNISKLVNDIFSCYTGYNKVEDVFDKLAKELNF